MFEINVDDKQIRNALDNLQTRLEDMSPLYRSIAHLLLSETLDNFANEGRPRWQQLSPVTIAIRTKLGTWPGKILDVHAGGLASSISTSSGSDFAMVGSNKVYAAIQQLGGNAGRNRKVKIPARPFLPITESKELQQTTQHGIMELLNEYLSEAANGA